MLLSSSQLLLRGRPAATRVHFSSGLPRNVLQGRPRPPAFKSAPFRGDQKRLAMSGTLSTVAMKESMKKDPLPWWLFGCAGMVATTLTVGAAASLTRSGASMLYWKPRGFLPPGNEIEWRNEFETYKEFCQHHQRKPMNLDDFKRNFKWEYAHRLLGQGTALAFTGPLAYFFVKDKLPVSIQAHLAGVLALGAAQMYVGRKMVRSNLEEHHRHEATDKIATFGLPAHAAFSMANMSLLLWTGFHLVSPSSRAVKLREITSSTALKEIGEIRKYFQAVTALLIGTIVAGTELAEIDGGKEYNTFPKMGKHWIPDGLFDQRPLLRNFYDNVAQVQLHHRLLAVGSLAAYTAVFLKARKPNVWQALPKESKTAMNVTMAAVGGQIVFGVTMLVNAVPMTLAMVHSSGAALILSSSLWTLYTLRFARTAGIAGAAAKTAAKNM